MFANQASHLPRILGLEQIQGRKASYLITALLAALAAGVAVPVFITPQPTILDSPWATMVPLAILILGLLAIKPRFSLLHTKTWILGYVAMSVLVRSFALLTNQNGAVPILRVAPPGEPLYHDIAIAQLQTALGLFSFGLFYWLVRRQLAASHKQKTNVYPRLHYPWAIGILALSLLTLPFQLALANAGSDPTTGGDFTLALPSYAAAGVGCIVAFTLWQDFKRALPTLLIAAVDALLRVFLLGAKSAAFALMLGLFLGYVAKLARRNATAGLRLKTLLPVPAFLVVALLIFSRPAAPTSADLWSRLYVGAQASISRSYGTDGLIAADAYLHDGQPLLLGGSFFEITYSWIPRQLWPDKPRSFSQRLGTSVFSFRSDAGRVFVAPGYGAEWLLNFGVIGLAVGWMVFGALSAWIDLRIALPYRALWIFALAHLVEGPVVSQFWLSAPFILGGSIAFWRSKSRLRKWSSAKPVTANA
jgi:oligosaccharide repeat unit polymerase